MKFTFLLPITLAATISLATAADPEPGFTSLFDGRSFTGWKLATENTNTWRIEDGALVCQGERCHLFYDGALQPFTNFVLRVEVQTQQGANGGVYFHTRYQDKGWPKYGFETQVNNTHGDWKKTGSIYDVMNVKESPAKDNQWWTQEITVRGNHVTVKVDGQIVTDYTEPPNTQAGKDFSRKLDSGTFALQAHDPKSVVRYKNIRVQPLK
jgi:hypothetical protein